MNSPNQFHFFSLISKSTASWDYHSRWSAAERYGVHHIISTGKGCAVPLSLILVLRSHVVGLFYPNFGKLFAVSSTENCVIKAEAKSDDGLLWLTLHRCARIHFTFLCGHSRVHVIVCILSHGL